MAPSVRFVIGLPCQAETGRGRERLPASGTESLISVTLSPDGSSFSVGSTATVPANTTTLTVTIGAPPFLRRRYPEAPTRTAIRAVTCGFAIRRGSAARLGRRGRDVRGGRRPDGRGHQDDRSVPGDLGLSGPGLRASARRDRPPDVGRRGHGGPRGPR